MQVDWRASVGAKQRLLLPLPTYPFQRLRCWRGLDESEPPDPRKTLYERGFSPAPLPPPAPAGSADSVRPWLLFCGDGGLEAALRERLLATGASVTTLVPGDRFSRVAPNRFRVRADSRTDLGAVLAACGMVDAGLAPRVLHLGSVTGSAGPHNTAEAFESAARTGFFSLLALVQAAHDQGLSNGLDVLMVADGLARLDGEPGLRHAEKAALLGAARDLQLELPDLRARVVDIPCQDDAAAPAWLVEALLHEASAADSPVFVCLRPESRLVEQLYALPELPESSPRLRDGGVVLITGGTGGLGLLFAGVLFDLCRARLALTARWASPPEATWPERARRDDKIGRALTAILTLRARGAEVLVVEADVADRAQVARALAETRARFGGLHGVIHAAVAVQPSAAIDKTRESAARVFGSKVHGAFHLEELLGTSPSICSSRSPRRLRSFPSLVRSTTRPPTPCWMPWRGDRAGRHGGLSRHRLGAVAGGRSGGQLPPADPGRRRRPHPTSPGAPEPLDFGRFDHPILRSWARESERRARVPGDPPPRPLARRRSPHRRPAPPLGDHHPTVGPHRLPPSLDRGRRG